MKIRKATLKDIKKILELSIEFDLEYFKKYKIKDFPPINELAKQKKKIFEKDLKNKKGVIFVAEKDEKDIGYIFTIKGIPRDRKFISKAYISDLYIKKEFRGKGIAKKLILESEEWCKKEKINEVFIDVNVKNLGAKKLYKKMKFNEMKLRLNKKIK